MASAITPAVFARPNPSDSHLFRSVVYGLAVLLLTNFEEVQIWWEEWVMPKDKSFYRYDIYLLPEE